MLVDFKFIYSYIYFFNFVKSFIDILYGKFCFNFLIDIILIFFKFCFDFVIILKISGYYRQVGYRFFDVFCFFYLKIVDYL